MNVPQRIAKNVSILFLSQMVGYVLGFFTLMYSARYLGVEGFGILSFALAFTGIFTVLMDLGLNTLTIREVARNKSLAQEYIANITLIKLLLSLTTFCLIFLIINSIGYNPQTMSVVYVIALYAILTTFSQLFYSVFQAHEKMEYQSLGSIINSSLLLLGVLIAINYELNIYQFSMIYAIAGSFILAYALFIFVWKFNFPQIEFNWKIWKSLIKESWPFAVTSISINLYLWIDTILLSVLQGPEAVGLYNAAYKLILVLLFIPIVFNSAVFPLMSQYFVSSKESLKVIFDKLFKIMILIGIPIGIGTLIIADKIILLIYGNQFLGSIIALQILIWSTVLIFLRSPLERLLESSNKQLSVTKIFILGAIFNTILNIIFIPKFSYVGAAIITILTDIIVFGLLIFTVKRNSGIFFSKGTKISIIKITVASFAMALVINQLKYLNIFLLIILGGIIYIVMLLIMRIWDNDEIILIKSLFKRGN
ncbi:MAG: flippase [Euryarchaeota archaeon]|nr:flippase [Euryarchaeota archaeon]MBV1767600.1 flippase [Methanobacterium sp.]